MQWLKVILYVHLREQIAKRLHHGLSETILVNNLTDIRELKKIPWILFQTKDNMIFCDNILHLRYENIKIPYINIEAACNDCSSVYAYVKKCFTIMKYLTIMILYHWNVLKSISLVAIRWLPSTLIANTSICGQNTGPFLPHENVICSCL